jgi:hypothetical protein
MWRRHTQSRYSLQRRRPRRAKSNIVPLQYHTVLAQVPLLPSASRSTRKPGRSHCGQCSRRRGHQPSPLRCRRWLIPLSQTDSNSTSVSRHCGTDSIIPSPGWTFLALVAVAVPSRSAVPGAFVPAVAEEPLSFLRWPFEGAAAYPGARLPRKDHRW